MLLVIGLDGATFDLLTPWLAEGYLPTIARLVQEGCSGPLTSTMPPVTAPAWATFMTGKNPGQHGVFDFFKPGSPNLDQSQLVNRLDVQARPFWDYLSQAGITVGILNVPVTYPPQPVNGFLIPGLLDPHEGRSTFPPEFLASYEPELGPYRLFPHTLYHPDRIDAFVAELREITETQIRYALRVAQDHPTDFLMVHFSTPDFAQHKLWHCLDSTHPWFEPKLGRRYGTAVRDIFAQIDAGLAELLAQLPEETAVMLVSDHGFGPQHGIVNLNNFFLQTGIMTLKQEARVRLRAWAFRQGWLAKGATRFARLWGREKLVSFADVDWQHTLAYSRGHMGQIYLNLQGREPQGIVPPSDYVAVRERVSNVLRELRHPEDKRPLISKIIPREEATQGPFQESGPDLHLIIDGYGLLAYPLFAADGKIVTQQRLVDSGNHRLNGILVATGAAMRAGQIDQAQLQDLAPTILHLLGVPVPEDMDGQVLNALLTESFQREHPVTKQSTLNKKEEGATALTAAMQAALTERLRSLGYLG